jgi:hypothetical protein
MAKRKRDILNKVLLQDEPLESFSDIFHVIPKQMVADAMKIDARTLNKRLADFGQFTFENFAILGESMGIEDAQIKEILILAFTQYLREKKKNQKRKL